MSPQRSALRSSGPDFRVQVNLRALHWRKEVAAQFLIELSWVLGPGDMWPAFLALEFRVATPQVFPVCGLSAQPQLTRRQGIRLGYSPGPMSRAFLPCQRAIGPDLVGNLSGSILR